LTAMTYFLRVFLIFLIIYLVLRSFIRAGSSKESVKSTDDSNLKNKTRKGVPKNLGEYVDYEEISEEE